MWEKKTSTCPGLRCVSNTYQWSSTGTAPDGDAFTSFLNTLNGGATGVGNCVSSDGSTQTGGFNNHCDWRLPTISELNSIVDLSASGCGSSSPCIRPVFGPTAASYNWSSSTDASFPNDALAVLFLDGSVYSKAKPNSNFVRAVRLVIQAPP